MRWTLLFQARVSAWTDEQRRTAKSCGPGAATLALSLWSFPQVTVAKKPAHRGEREVSRKAIAQGMSECFRCPVCSCAPFLRTLAHETAGAARTRHSLRPRFSRVRRGICKTQASSSRENEHACLHVIARSEATKQSMAQRVDRWIASLRSQ